LFGAVRPEKDLPPALRVIDKPPMRTRTLLLISLVLNVALISALVTWLSSPRAVAPPVRPPNFAAIASNQPVRIVKTNILVRPRIFTWQEVESADYAVYVENLRALGMPETTIRDIIVADIDQIFLQRQRADAAQQDMEWWRAVPSQEMQSNLLARAQGMESERQALLAKLLGPDWAKDRPQNDELPLGLAGPVLSALPDEVKARVQEIAQRSSARMAAYVAQVEALGQPLNPVEVARLRDETRAQLAAVLPAAALEEFLLRYSENANQLRRELGGLNPTPEEFRAVFRAVDALDRELPLRAGSDAESQRARAALETQRLAALRAALGPQRFAAYQAAMDPAYRDAVQVAEQVGGDRDTVLALYEISRASNDTMNRIRNDASLSDAQRAQQLREAEAEQLRARAEVLGGPAATEAPASAPAATETPMRLHGITPGDTLGILALRYGVSANAIRAANPDLNLDRVGPGTVINVPPPPAANLPASIYPPGLRRKP
jgi:LysM repeat protein